MKNQDRFISRLTARDGLLPKPSKIDRMRGRTGTETTAARPRPLLVRPQLRCFSSHGPARRRRLTICYSFIGLSRRFARTGSARASRKSPISWKGTTKCSEELEGMGQIMLDNADAQVRASLKSWDTKLRSPRTGSRSSNPLKRLDRFPFGYAAGACCREQPASAYYQPLAVTATTRIARILKRGVRQQQSISTITA